MFSIYTYSAFFATSDGVPLHNPKFIKLLQRSKIENAELVFSNQIHTFQYYILEKRKGKIDITKHVFSYYILVIFSGGTFVIY